MVCMHVPCVFIVDIADKGVRLVGTCLMSCQRMKIGLCVCVTVEIVGRWRQMGDISLPLANIHSFSHAILA